MDKAPLENLVFLHLLILLPSVPLSEKIKSWLVEKMRLEPNIKSLDQVAAYIQAQESDYVASKGAQDTKVNHVKPQNGDVTKEPKKDILCRICSKKHPKFKCTYTCKFCWRKGHDSEACWTKFSEKAPGYIPATRENTPALGKNPKVTKKWKTRRSKSTGSDRGSLIRGFRK